MPEIAVSLLILLCSILGPSGHFVPQEEQCVNNRHLDTVFKNSPELLQVWAGNNKQRSWTEQL